MKTLVFKRIPIPEKGSLGKDFQTARCEREPGRNGQKGRDMRTAKGWIVSLAMGALLISGCAPILISGVAVGAGSGTYFFINGEMKTDYYHSFDTTWNACQKTVADMRGLDVLPEKEIGKGKISAMIDEEKVQITVAYKAKNVTTVAIRVGLIGNKLSSQLIHDKIGDNLPKK
jgi:hypothetical protein